MIDTPAHIETSHKTGLAGKLLAIIIAVGTIPLILAMVLSYLQGHESLRGVIGSSFQALAYTASTKIDLLLEDEINRITHLSQHPALIQTLTRQNIKTSKPSNPSTQLDTRSNPASQALDEFLNTSSTPSIASIFLTDQQGRWVASTIALTEEKNRDRRSLKEIIEKNSQQAFVGDLERNDQLQDYVFEIAVPVTSSDGRVQGVLHHLLLAKPFFASSIEGILFGETGHIMLINSEGVVIDCPILPTGHRLEGPDLLQAIAVEKPSWVETQGNGHGSQELSIIGIAPLDWINSITRLSTGKRWYTFVWQSSEELFAPTQTLFLWITSAGLVSVVLIGLMGRVAARRMVKPIQTLQRTAGAIGRGEQVEPLTINTGDEIETLANEINTMNVLLQKTFSGLEQKVEEKTQEVDYLKEYTDCILMSVPEIILIFDQHQKVEYANVAFEKITGLTRDAYAGRMLTNIALEHRDQWNVIADDLYRFSQGSQPMLTKTSTGFHNYQARDPLSPSNGAGEEDSNQTTELGDRVFAYVFFNVVLKSKRGRRVGLIMKDMTEEKKLLDQLTLADKLSGLGTLAAGIAHEMNNPLYTIMGFTEAIKDETDSPEISQFADKVLDRSRHMASIILNLTGYSRSNDQDPRKQIDVNDNLDAAAEMALMASYSDDIKLEKHYSELPELNAKPEEIQQVFHNIIRNAVQAMQGKGKIKIKTIQNNGSIEVLIEDDGPGIPREYLTRIFDPFFTTKGQGEGTGLGLNLVHRIVEQYGGDIQVESDAGQGTRFRVVFPLPVGVRTE